LAEIQKKDKKGKIIPFLCIFLPFLSRCFSDFLDDEKPPLILDDFVDFSATSII